MNRLRTFFRQIMMSLVAVFPGSAPAIEPQSEDDQNRIKQKDERLAKATRRTRMWVTCFPKLTAEQQADPKIHAIMPWSGRGHMHDMAEITQDQWNPEVILKNAKGK